MLIHWFGALHRGLEISYLKLLFTEKVLTRVCYPLPSVFWNHRLRNNSRQVFEFK